MLYVFLISLAVVPFASKADCHTTDISVSENVIVHEWGHLRWGLKDEIPIPNLPKFYDAGDIRKPIK